MTLRVQLWFIDASITLLTPKPAHQQNAKESLDVHQHDRHVCHRRRHRRPVARSRNRPNKARPPVKLEAGKSTGATDTTGRSSRPQ